MPTFKEKLKELLKNNYIEDCPDKILSLIIEELPEKKIHTKPIKIAFIDGYNTYLSEVIKMLKGV